MVFENNHAEYTGGAIYVHVAQARLNSACPLKRPSKFSALVFDNNTAGYGGDAVYGGNFDSALAPNREGKMVICIELFNNYSILQNQTGLSTISSDPLRVCLCDTAGLPDCLHIFYSRTVYPGETFTLPVVAVGQTFSTASGYVYAQLLNKGACSLGNLQHFQ